MDRRSATATTAPDVDPPVVLVVAGWYPALDGRTAGRFVADQVRALAATSAVRPVVLAFDPLRVWGSTSLRRRERGAVAEALRAWAASPASGALHDRAGGTDAPGPIARIAVPGPDSATPASRVVDERTAALETVLTRIVDAAGPIGLVHAHGGLPDGVAAARLAARLGVPFVLTEHASTLPAIADDPARRPLYAEATGRASAVVAVSRTLAGDLERIDPAVTARLHVVPNVVQLGRVEPGSPEGRVSGELLFVGFRKTSKGIDLLLDAFALAARRRQGLRLRLVGPPGPAADERRWRARAAECGAPVSFEGEMDALGVAEAMARADVFVHPSPRETFGVVAAETLAAGLPVVAADSGGVPEILGPEPERFGRVVPAGDASALSAAILDVLAHRHAFDPAASRAMVEARFGPDAVATGLLEVYRAAGLTLPSRASTASEHAGVSPVQPPIGPTVVVGLNRRRLAQILDGLSPADRAQVVAVTADEPDIPLPAGLRATVGVPEAAVRFRSLEAVAGTAGTTAADRRRRLLHRPRVVLAELLWRLPWRERRLLAATRAAIDAAALESAAPAPLLVALDAFDGLAAAPVVEAGRVTPAPGGGRWLGDRAPAARSASEGSRR